MRDITEKLLQWKRRLRKAEGQSKKIDGVIENLFQQLKDLGSSSLSGAEKKIAAYTKENKKKKRALAKGVNAIEDKYNW